MSRGRFIVLEGIDGSGTTTQTARLADALRGRGHAVVTTREPSDLEVGALVRNAVRTGTPDLDERTVALLFAADRLDHIRREVEPALTEGQVVVCDRYVLSSLAYQSSSLEPSMGDAALGWVEALNAQAARPDLTLLLDLPADAALARVAERRVDGEAEERYDAADTQRALADRYRALAQRPGAEVTVVDGTASIEEITSRLVAHCATLGL